MMGWFKKIGGCNDVGPFMYGSAEWSSAFLAYLYCKESPPQLHLGYWMNKDKGVNPVIKPVVDNQWYHVAFSWDGTKNTVYVQVYLVNTQIQM